MRAGQASCVSVMVLAMALAGGGVVQAKEQARAPGEPAAAPAEAAPSSAPAVTKSPQEELREQVRRRLDGTAWTMELRPEGGGKSVKDTLTFAGRTVASDLLAKAGYNASNYSVHVQEDGVGVWETMQSKEGGDRAFWRGELSGETMSGVLSKQPGKGEAVTYYFTASAAKAAAAQAAPAAGPPAPAASKPSASPPAAQQEAPKKKRRWF